MADLASHPAPKLIASLPQTETGPCPITLAPKRTASLPAAEEARRAELTRARRAARAGLPEPDATAGRIAMALLEVEAGWRSALQLERVCAKELWSVLERTMRRGGHPLPTNGALVGVHCQELDPGLVEATVTVRRGQRTQAVAMRLVASPGRWVVTALELLRFPAEGG